MKKRFYFLFNLPEKNVVSSTNRIIIEYCTEETMCTLSCYIIFLLHTKWFNFYYITVIFTISINTYVLRRLLKMMLYADHTFISNNYHVSQLYCQSQNIFVHTERSKYCFPQSRGIKNSHIKMQEH